MSKLTLAGLLAFAVLAGCADGTNSNNGHVTVTNSKAKAPKNLTKAKVATCWKGAGLKGDIYKFLKPAEAAGISRISGASAQQMKSFKTCIAS